MSITTIASSEEIKKISFPGQHKDEQIILIKRRHYIVMLGFVLTIIFLILVPFFVYFFLLMVLEIPDTEIFKKLFLFTVSIYYMLLATISFFAFIDYYLDVWIITNQRVLSIEQKGLFHRRITELRYGQIQDITSEVSGIVATYFRFGNIKIQTAAEEERVVLKEITHPIETRRIISDEYRKATENIEIKKPTL